MAKKKKDISRPFDPDILERAEELSKNYEILIWHEDDEWYGRGVEYPDVFGDGATPQACLEATRQAITTTLAYELENNITPALPARDKKRTEQVNVRLSIDEKMMLENESRQMGFTGLSDFIRTAAMTYGARKPGTP